MRNLHTSGKDAGHVQYALDFSLYIFLLVISTGFIALFINTFTIPTIQRLTITDKTFV